jgi:pyruvate/2-oxoglutarate dehydrogenase complex dihydrolipoamide acyltransferase (E2) component
MPDHAAAWTGLTSLEVCRVGTPIAVPTLGVAVTEATILEWHVKDGDHVAKGQPLYTVATDKTETEIEAPAEGTIHLIGEREQTYPVGHLIAEIN